MLDRNLPLAIFMDGASNQDMGKMGFGVLRYSPNPIACVIDSESSMSRMSDYKPISRDAPIVSTIDQALALGAKVLVLGIAPSGGLIPPEWWPVMNEAVAKGMSLVNGLHDLVGPKFSDLPAGQFIWDVRVEPAGIGVGTGAAAKLKNRRVLMIGTDMAIGKMTAGLEIFRSAKEQGIKAEFVATGQIGITITGRGVPLDAVRLDYACGAVESEVMAYEEAELIIVEGQGALLHPGSSANLPLLRGSCPTHLILCHRAGQTTLSRLPDVPIPPLAEYIALYEDLAAACGAFPRPTTVGVSLNTAHLGDIEAYAATAQIAGELGVPCVDPVRHGTQALLDAILA